MTRSDAGSGSTLLLCDTVYTGTGVSAMNWLTVNLTNLLKSISEAFNLKLEVSTSCRSAASTHGTNERNETSCSNNC